MRIELNLFCGFCDVQVDFDDPFVAPRWRILKVIQGDVIVYRFDTA